MEPLYLILGILLGGGGVYWLQRGEMLYLRQQITIITDLYNARLGYRKPKDDVAPASTPETPSQGSETPRTHVDDEFPDLFARIAETTAKTEAETLKKMRAEVEMMENSVS